MRQFIVLLTSLLLATSVVSCKKKDKASDDKGMTAGSGKVVEPPPAPTPPPVPPPEPKRAVGVPTDSDVQPAAANLADVKFGDGPPILPKGFQIAVLEGTPPFSEPKSFAFLLKFPKNYVVPPHTHAVEERVTVLKGTLNLGDGDKVDKKKTKPLKVGGVVAVPAGGSHYAWTSEETIVHVQGVGPFGITYRNPKDDPRQPPPAAEAKLAETTDSSTAPVMMNAEDIKFGPAPPILPAGAQIAVIEGTPPFTDPKSYIFRLKFADGYKISPHFHNSTERVIVVSGALKFAGGDKWDDKSLKELGAGAVGHIPKTGNHFVQAKGETVVQIQGVGPFDINWVDPNDDPSKPAATK